MRLFLATIQILVKLGTEIGKSYMLRTLTSLISHVLFAKVIRNQIGGSVVLKSLGDYPLVPD